MKPKASSLNPRATSYIPSPNREDSKTVITENSSDDSIGRGQNAPVAVASPVNNPPARGSVSQHSNESSELEKFDGQFKMDLRYLLDNFITLSKEYLTNVYLENERDLEATLAMLRRLKIKPERLPDSLGIGDTSESKSAAVGLESGSLVVGRPSSLESGSAAVGRPSSKKNVAKGSK